MAASPDPANSGATGAGAVSAYCLGDTGCDKGEETDREENFRGAVDRRGVLGVASRSEKETNHEHGGRGCDERQEGSW